MKAGLISILFLLLPAHDFHLSLTEIVHNEEANTMEVSVKLFTDDLIVVLQQAGAPKMEIGTDNEPPQANELVESYLRNHLRVLLNDKSVEFKYLGKQAELDATWCFLEISGIRKIRSIRVENSIMLEAFDDQTNMVNLKVNGRKKSGLARKGNTKLKFEF